MIGGPLEGVLACLCKALLITSFMEMLCHFGLHRGKEPIDGHCALHVGGLG
jgi:hypothetical protein